MGTAIGPVARSPGDPAAGGRVEGSTTGLNASASSGVALVGGRAVDAETKENVAKVSDRINAATSRPLRGQRRGPTVRPDAPARVWAPAKGRGGRAAATCHDLAGALHPPRSRLAASLGQSTAGVAQASGGTASTAGAATLRRAFARGPGTGARPPLRRPGPDGLRPSIRRRPRSRGPRTAARRMPGRWPA